MHENTKKVAGARRRNRAKAEALRAAQTRESIRTLGTTAVAVVGTGVATNTAVGAYVLSEHGAWVIDALSVLPPVGVAGVVTAGSFGASVVAVWFAGLFTDALGAVRRRRVA